jgi:DNA mismatch repair protein MutS
LTTEQTLDIQGLRHLLIELINPDVRYIPNDCELVTSNSPHSGMLLYGVNSCGKTSYLKAVGMSVVLAQAGLFVPASGMKFRPFSKIMTRIAGGDNMERSQSSYIVELDELLSVIQRSDDRTLVLGDEMCRGTEVESANAMVYSVLKWLVERKTLFISATHLHDIVPEVERNLGDRISIFHMTVTFEDDQVFYDRVLVKGAGPRLYGLEIAKAMNFPDSFMRRALDFRISHVQPSQQQQQSPQQQKERSPPKTSRSRYNSKKILVRCEACGYRPNSSRCMPLDTHHIEFQCNADSDGYHGTQNKNALHNLVCLCKECHVRVHRGTLSIKTLQTLKGTKYKFEEITDRNPRSCDVR